jgi:hypothetical protein
MGSSTDMDTDGENEPRRKRSKSEKEGSIRELVLSNNKLLQELLKQQNKTNNKLDKLQEENTQQAKQIQVLEEKVEFLSKGGQYNFILQGQPEVDSENVKQVAESLIKKILKIDINLLYAMRIGRKPPSGSRHILMKVRSNEDKIQIRNNQQLLRDYNKQHKTALFMNEDVPRSERIRQVQLRKSLKIAKESDPDAKLRGNFIMSKGSRFKVNDDGKLTKMRNT